MKDFDQYAMKKGEPLMPDFFLDEWDKGYIGGGGKQVDMSKVGGQGGGAGASGGAPAVAAAAAQDQGVQQVFDNMSKVLNEELVQKTKAVFQFDIKGEAVTVVEAGMQY